MNVLQRVLKYYKAMNSYKEIKENAINNAYLSETEVNWDLLRKIKKASVMDAILDDVDYDSYRLGYEIIESLENVETEINSIIEKVNKNDSIIEFGKTITQMNSILDRLIFIKNSYCATRVTDRVIELIRYCEKEKQKISNEMSSYRKLAYDISLNLIEGKLNCDEVTLEINKIRELLKLNKLNYHKDILKAYESKVGWQEHNYMTSSQIITIHSYMSKECDNLKDSLKVLNQFINSNNDENTNVPFSLYELIWIDAMLIRLDYLCTINYF